MRNHPAKDEILAFLLPPFSGVQSNCFCVFFPFQEEQSIYDAFSHEEFTSKFISFLSLEDRKGKDKFNVHRFVLFKVRKRISVFSDEDNHDILHSCSLKSKETQNSLSVPLLKSG